MQSRLWAILALTAHVGCSSSSEPGPSSGSSQGNDGGPAATSTDSGSTATATEGNITATVNGEELSIPGAAQVSGPDNEKRILMADRQRSEEPRSR